MEDPERSALLKDAQTQLRRKDCVRGMVESIDVAVKDATIIPSKEGYALDMEQSVNYAAAKDAQMYLSTEVCAFNMGRRRSYAA